VDNESFSSVGIFSELNSEELTETHQRQYVRYFRDAPAAVLEIGCGRGVMLHMLQEAGIQAYGIDSSEESVKLCEGKGVKVLPDDAVHHLASLPDASLGGIFCAHMIEHMQPEYVIKLIKESYRVLKPGAVFIIITPNAKDLRTTERFWLDISHVRLYPEKLLTAILKKAGFSEIKITEGKEPGRNLLVKIAKVMLKIWFMGFMFRGDLVVTVRR
jgi:O-antigen chain-terminating methyltransferase